MANQSGWYWCRSLELAVCRHTRKPQRFATFPERSREHQQPIGLTRALGAIQPVDRDRPRRHRRPTSLIEHRDRVPAAALYHKLTLPR